MLAGKHLFFKCYMTFLYNSFSYKNAWRFISWTLPKEKTKKDDKERCEKNIEIFLKKEKKKMTIVLWMTEYRKCWLNIEKLFWKVAKFFATIRANNLFYHYCLQYKKIFFIACEIYVYASKDCRYIFHFILSACKYFFQIIKLAIFKQM